MASVNGGVPGGRSLPATAVSASAPTRSTVMGVLGHATSRPAEVTSTVRTPSRPASGAGSSSSQSDSKSPASAAVVNVHVSCTTSATGLPPSVQAGSERSAVPAANAVTTAARYVRAGSSRRGQTSRERSAPESPSTAAATSGTGTEDCTCAQPHSSAAGGSWRSSAAGTLRVPPPYTMPSVAVSTTTSAIHGRSRPSVPGPRGREAPRQVRRVELHQREVVGLDVDGARHRVAAHDLLRRDRRDAVRGQQTHVLRHRRPGDLSAIGIVAAADPAAAGIGGGDMVGEPAPQSREEIQVGHAASSNAACAGTIRRRARSAAVRSASTAVAWA